MDVVYLVVVVVMLIAIYPIFGKKNKQNNFMINDDLRVFFYKLIFNFHISAAKGNWNGGNGSQLVQVCAHIPLRYSQRPAYWGICVNFEYQTNVAISFE